MICRDLNGDLLLFCQNDHAHLSGELLSVWRDPILIDHPRREELLFAVRRHDNGWQETDAAPLLHPSGDRPHDFLSIPHPLRLEIWERGTARFAAERPYAALLITEHALRLLSPLKISSAAVSSGSDTATPAEEAKDAEDDILGRLRDRRDRLLVASGMDEESLAGDYRWLQLADFLSLVMCTDRRGPFSTWAGGGRLEDGVLRLSPFPLAGATTLHIAARRLERRAFDGDADLGAALAACRWERWPVPVDRA